MKYIAYKVVECPQCGPRNKVAKHKGFTFREICKKCQEYGGILKAVPVKEAMQEDFDDLANEWFRKQRPKQEKLR